MVVCLHQYSQQSEEKQYIGSILSNSTLWQVRISRRTVWIRLNIQTIILVYKVQVVP